MPIDTSGWLQHALDTSRDYAVVLLDDTGRIVEWLGAAENVFGHATDEAVGEPFSLLFTPEDRDAGLDRQEMELARTTGRSEDDRWHLRKGGTRFWGSGILQPVRRDDTLLGYCKVLRDRTDVRTQLDAQQHRIAAQAADIERRREFMVSLGHELRNPLAPIRATTYTIQRLGEPKLQRACEVLERQVEVMVRLLDDLTEATRADARVGRSLMLEPVTLQDVLQTAANGIQPAIAAKRQQLSVVVPDVTISFEADRARLQQMLLNLLGNASKFTPEGGHVSVAASIEAEMIVIHIEDDGPGIADDVLPHIFELFTRGTRTASEVDGLGVGLAVVKDLATAHGGGVEARSGAERGSVFTLRLPLRQKTAGG